MKKSTVFSIFTVVVALLALYNSPAMTNDKFQAMSYAILSLICYVAALVLEHLESIRVKPQATPNADRHREMFEHLIEKTLDKYASINSERLKNDRIFLGTYSHLSGDFEIYAHSTHRHGSSIPNTEKPGK